MLPQLLLKIFCCGRRFRIALQPTIGVGFGWHGATDIVVAGYQYD
jgi:hypothetical protein